MKFKVGDKVRIVDNTGGHEFDIGEVVTIAEILEGDYRAKNNYDSWYVGDEELELVEDTEGVVEPEDNLQDESGGGPFSWPSFGFISNDYVPEREVAYAKDMVNNPSHYNSEGSMSVVEPEDYFEDYKDNKKVESDGGPSSYYDFPKGKGAWVTLNDLNDYKALNQWGPLSFHMTNVSKAAFRFGEKSGTSKVYDVNKIIYSGLRMKLMLEDKVKVRKYLQQLLEDPQFQLDRENG